MRFTPVKHTVLKLSNSIVIKSTVVTKILSNYKSLFMVKLPLIYPHNFKGIIVRAKTFFPKEIFMRSEGLWGFKASRGHCSGTGTLLMY